MPPTHTYSLQIDTCTHMHAGAQAHTQSSTVLSREVNSSLTSSCIMWVECSTEVAKYIATVTVLKWGDITRVSSDLKVKAICNTIGDGLCSIEDLFDEIMGENTTDMVCEGWSEGGSEWTMHLLQSALMRRAYFKGSRDLCCTVFTEKATHVHTHTAHRRAYFLGNELGSMTVHLK